MEQNTKEFLYKSGAFLMIALGITAVTYTLVGFKTMRFIGSGVQPTNVVTVEGEGEVYTSPDIATFSVTVREEAKKVASAQEIVKGKINKVLAMLEEMGVEEKDISTAYYSSYPKYDYEQIVCIRYPCPTQKPTITGYEVSHSITVKVRDIDSSGDVVEKLAELGITEVSGPNFSIDKEDEFKNEARRKAIIQAKEKAEQLAEDLGVDIVRVVNFSENRRGYPIYAMKATAPMYEEGMGGDAETTQIPSGENKISSFVTITYEIR